MFHYTHKIVQRGGVKVLLVQVISLDTPEIAQREDLPLRTYSRNVISMVALLS